MIAFTLWAISASPGLVENRPQLNAGVVRTANPSNESEIRMTPALAHEPYDPTFVVATIPAAVRDAIKRIVQARAELTEAHLVATRASVTSPGAPALVILSAEPTAVSALEGDLRGVLQRHVRPKILLLSPDDPDLPWIRGLGGELKRQSGRFPWWLLFLGM